MHPGIKELIHSFPEKPGVYRHYDTKGRLLYVGKAKNLKRRVSSYFTKTHDSFRLRLLVKQITDIQFTVVKDEKEALKFSNNHVYGLGAAVFTRDQEKGLEFAKNIKCGTCAINSGISSDFSLPFGGVGRSGFGRELGLEGLKAFANIKSIVSS